MLHLLKKLAAEADYRMCSIKDVLKNFVKLLADFIVEVKGKYLSDFMSTYNLKSLVKQKTCFKNPENPSRIDLILTNSLRSFQNNSVFETGLSDFYNCTTTV